MGRDISLFSGYSQEENRTTNYCLLMMKMIYDESPSLLSALLDTLLLDTLSSKEGVEDIVGVSFLQQIPGRTSVPDGMIAQQGFKILIETKRGHLFNEVQLQGHINELGDEGKRILVALGTSGEFDTTQFDTIQAICDKAGVIFSRWTFDLFNDGLDKIAASVPRLSDTISDFQMYLAGAELLSDWEDQFDVANCAKSMDEVQNERVYFCPAGKRAYSHKRCKFFGVYKGKAVRTVCEIRAVVELGSACIEEARIVFMNIRDESELALKQSAVEKAKKFRPDDFPLQVFLLGESFETEFPKDTPGGMFGSRLYFNISGLNPKPRTANDLAIALRGRRWSEGPLLQS